MCCVAGLAASEDVLDRRGPGRFLRGGDLVVKLTRSMPVGPLLADDPERTHEPREHRSSGTPGVRSYEPDAPMTQTLPTTIATAAPVITTSRWADAPWTAARSAMMPTTAANAVMAAILAIPNTSTYVSAAIRVGRASAGSTPRK